MGLTIHYGLKTDHNDVASVRSLVQGIRESATRLPFQEIGDVVKLKSGGPDMVIERAGKIDGRLILLCAWMTDGKVRCSTFYSETLEHA